MGQWFEICILLASSLRMLRFLIPFWKEKLVCSASSNLWLCLCHPVKKLCHSFKLCCLKGSSVFTKQMKWLLIQISPRYVKTRASNKSTSDKSMTQKKKTFLVLKLHLTPFPCLTESKWVGFWLHSTIPVVCPGMWHDYLLLNASSKIHLERVNCPLATFPPPFPKKALKC